MTPVILASKSAARAQVLSAAGVVFETAGAGVDESAAKEGLLADGATPRDVAEALAQLRGLLEQGRGGQVLAGRVGLALAVGADPQAALTADGAPAVGAQLETLAAEAAAEVVGLVD